MSCTTILALRFTFREKQEQKTLAKIVNIAKVTTEFYYFQHPEYGCVLDVKILEMYFPQIVISSDPIYHKIIKDILERMKKDDLEAPINLEFISDPKEVEVFDNELSYLVSSLSYEDLKTYSSTQETPHCIYNHIDKFEFLLSLIPDKKFFSENIRYIVGAFYRKEEKFRYHSRSEREIIVDDWLKISRRFEIPDDFASEYFYETDKYAYSLITMEEVIKRNVPKADKHISKYNECCLKSMIRKLFFQNHDPTANELWQPFAKFVSRDHFYSKKKIYVLDGQKCKEIEANEMRPVINRYVMYIHEVYVDIRKEAEDKGDTIDFSSLDKRRRELIKPFENTTSASFVTNACANYLSTDIKDEVLKTAVAFRDIVIIYDQNRLFKRKAFMEDHFFSTASVQILGKRDFDAEKEVKETLFKMFADADNVKWFIKFMGSLLVHHPERVCAILYGPKGGNAKTTVANVLIKILGGFAHQARPDCLIAGKVGGITCTPFDMELKDKVLTVVSEPNRAQSYSSSVIKDLTGGDIKTGAKKFKDPESFKQTSKIMILCNNVPNFDEVDQALLSRLYITKCIGRFIHEAPSDPEEQKKQHLYPVDENYWTEVRIRALAHILVYEGFNEYMKEKLVRTASQEKELEKWKEITNPFKRFLDKTSPSDHGNKCYTNAKELHQAFVKTATNKNISYDDFKFNIEKISGWKIHYICGSDYYPCFLAECPDRILCNETLH